MKISNVISKTLVAISLFKANIAQPEVLNFGAIKRSFNVQPAIYAAARWGACRCDRHAHCARTPHPQPRLAHVRQHVRLPAPRARARRPPGRCAVQPDTVVTRDIRHMGRALYRAHLSAAAAGDGGRAKSSAWSSPKPPVAAGTSRTISKCAGHASGELANAGRIGPVTLCFCFRWSTRSGVGRWRGCGARSTVGRRVTRGKG